MKSCSPALSYVVILLLCAGSPSIVTAGELPTIENPITTTRTKISTINVIIDSTFYNPNIIINVLSLLNQTKFRQQSELGYNFLNEIQIHYSIWTQQDHKSMVDFLLSIEETGTVGHEFNSTEFEVGSQYVFSNITGRRYDAEATLSYLQDTYWDGTPNEYSLFLFNLTDMDRGMNHWFSVNPIDTDTGIPQTTFYSNTRGLIHGKSVSAWGGHQGLPLHFIDLSTELWYGDFINTVWATNGYTDTLVSNKLQDFANQTVQESWIQDYLHVFIRQTYDLQFIGDSAPIGQSVRVQIINLFDWYEYNISHTDTKRMISPDKIHDTFQSAFPWLDFNITDEWYDLSDFETLIDEMIKYRNQLADGTFEIELNQGLITYISQSFIPEMFDLATADIVLPSLVFFLNDTTFTYNGVRLAGIGGQGFQLQGLTPQRYYDDRGRQIRGFSEVIVHEVGHSLGLSHPFSTSDSWVGDMTASVMGYYTSAPQFSQYDINSLGYYYSDHYLVEAEYIQSQYSGNHDLRDYIDSWIVSSQKHQRDWNFKRSIFLSQMALCGYAEIYETDLPYCDEIDLQDATQDTSLSSTKTWLLTFNDPVIWSTTFLILITLVSRRRTR